jgi:putative SOS response-associated peptidase YedK
VEEMNKSPLVDKWQRTTGITTYGEIRPTNVVPVIASNRAGSRAVFPMKWGFSGRTLLMNARTETAPVNSTFKEAWASHRCITGMTPSLRIGWGHYSDASGSRGFV